MMLHLAACSYIKAPPIDYKTNSKILSNSHTLLDIHQTHKVLKLWSKASYPQKINLQQIKLDNKHPHAKQFHQIISGYEIASFRGRTRGIGLPVIVQTRKQKFKQITEHSYQSNVHPATLVASIAPSGNIHLSLIDTREKKSFLGRKLATQKNLVIDHVFNDPENRSLSFRGLLNPLQFQHIQGLYLSRPYNKKRIPIVMIHGIFSSPETFMTLAETIESNPELYKKYQIWHYYYPTGTPWIATAHQFRSDFRELIKKLDPKREHSTIHETVIIAHSMGGLISTLSLSNPSKTLTKSYLGEQGMKLLNADQKRKLKPYFEYAPLNEPKQLILLGVPHQGSRLAKGFLGWAMDHLIAIPNILLKESQKILTPVAINKNSHLPKHTVKLLTEGENAVNQLQPENPAILALNNMKPRKGLVIHSIVGDIGRPLIRLYTDGVVSYKSSHLPHGNSETIVPSNHDITDDPKTIQQVIKLLSNN